MSELRRRNVLRQNERIRRDPYLITFSIGLRCLPLRGSTPTEGTKMEERDEAALAALPAILAYILSERRPPVDAHDDDRWLQAFLEARDMSFAVGNHWAFRKDN